MTQLFTLRVYPLSSVHTLMFLSEYLDPFRQGFRHWHACISAVYLQVHASAYISTCIYYMYIYIICRHLCVMCISPSIYVNNYIHVYFHRSILCISMYCIFVYLLYPTNTNISMHLSIYRQSTPSSVSLMYFHTPFMHVSPTPYYTRAHNAHYPYTGQMVPTQLVQMPWGFYPANLMPPQNSAAQQGQPVNNPQQRLPSDQRPLTPGQQAQTNMSSGDGSFQPINAPQMQMPPGNVVDMNGQFVSSLVTIFIWHLYYI